MIEREIETGIVGGVAAGLAKSYDLPANFVRILFIMGFLLFGIGLIVYLRLWNKFPQSTNQIQLRLN